MQIVNKENGNTYQVKSFQHGQINFVHPSAGVLIARLNVTKEGEVSAYYFCNASGKVTARFDIIDPTADVLTMIEDQKRSIVKAAQEKEEARQRFINQEEYKGW